MILSWLLVVALSAAILFLIGVPWYAYLIGGLVVALVLLAAGLIRAAGSFSWPGL